MKNSRIIILIIITIILSHSASSLHAEDYNLLQNPGFEEGIVGWSIYGGSLSSDESQVRSGAYAGALTSNTLGTIWLYQTVPIRGGDTYTLCGFALKNDPDIERVFLRISWYESGDGFGTEISHIDSLSSLTDDQPQYLLLTISDVTAPSDARSARIKAVVVPHSAAPASVYFDDFSFIGPAPTPSPTPTPVPAPTSTSTPNPSPNPTLSPTPTATPVSTPTHLPTPTLTHTSTPVPTPTRTPRPSPTTSPTSAPMPTHSRTPFPTQTTSPAPTPTPISTPTPADEGAVVINEIQYDPPQTGIDSSLEWIELLNRTGQSIGLTDWKIGDNHDTDTISSLIIPPGDFAIVAASADFYINFPAFSGNIVFIADGSIGNGLSNTGDRLILTDPTGKIIDALSYGDDTAVISPPCQDVAEGHSLERQPAGFDTDQASDFVDNASPSTGYGLPPATPDPTPSPSPIATSTPTPTPSPAATPTSTPSPAPSPTPSRSPTPTTIITDTPAPTSAPSPAQTPAPTPKPTPSLKPTFAPTPSPSPIPTSSPPPAPLPTIIQTITITYTVTYTTVTPATIPMLTSTPMPSPAPDSQTQTKVNLIPPAMLFLTGLTLLATVFWLKRGR